MIMFPALMFKFSLVQYIWEWATYLGDESDVEEFYFGVQVCRENGLVIKSLSVSE
jgi:hypothetical protein